MDSGLYVLSPKHFVDPFGGNRFEMMSPQQEDSKILDEIKSIKRDIEDLKSEICSVRFVENLYRDQVKLVENSMYTS